MLSEHEVVQFDDLLKEKGISHDCPECHAKGFRLIATDGYAVSTYSNERPKDDVLIPAIAYFCAICGRTSTFTVTTLMSTVGKA